MDNLTSSALLSFGLVLLGSILTLLAAANVGGHISILIGSRVTRFLIGGIGAFLLVLGIIGVVRELFLNPLKSPMAARTLEENSDFIPTATVEQATQRPTGEQPILTPPSSDDLPVRTEDCFRECWQYDDNSLTMTWIGPIDGKEDIWQPPGEALENIRDGYTAIFNTSVPGEILACTLTIDGTFIKDTCDGALYQIAPGTYRVISANRDVGGFRWCPALGYGWRVEGGDCK